MDISSPAAPTGVDVDIGRVVRNLGVVPARASSRRGVTVPTPTRGMRSVFLQTALIRPSLLLLDTLNYFRVGRTAVVGVAVSASSGGVVLRRGRTGGFARVIARETADGAADGAAEEATLLRLVASVGGARAIDVAYATAARRVGVLVGVVVLHKLTVGFVVLAFAFGVARRRANVSSTATAGVSNGFLGRASELASTRGAIVLGAETMSGRFARLRTDVASAASSTRFEFTTTGLGSGHDR